MAAKKTILARVLTPWSFKSGAPLGVNSLLSISESEAKELVKQGVLDDSEAAVDYCKTQLKIEPVDFDDTATSTAATNGEGSSDGESKQN